MSWEYFKTALCNSMIEIGHPYFEVQRYEASTVLRERVYCYELYHQLRNNLGDDYEFTLHAEINKRGQKIVYERVGADTDPDFVVHIPGAGLARQFQLVVIEVKSASNLDENNLEQDLNKLRVYVEEVEYQYGVFLVFGPRNYNSSVFQLIQDADIPDNVFIFWHDEVGVLPQIFGNEDTDEAVDV